MSETLMIKIWKYDPITGYWKYVRDCYRERKDDWLKILRGDEPGIVFRAVNVRPKTAPTKDA